MKRRSTTNIIGVLIAVIMCLSLLPTTALAAEIERGDIEEFVIENGMLIKYTGAGGHVVIPEGVTEIGGFNGYGFSNPFLKRTDITGVTIPDSVTSIGPSAFVQSGITSITIPDSVTSIGGAAFRGCPNLESVTIGNGVTEIGTAAFSTCQSLRDVTIGNSVTTIGDGAFQNCTSLKSITLPESVTSIGSEAFVDFETSKVLNITINSATGSKAETYAKEQGILFVSTGGTTDSEKPTEPPTLITSEKPSTWAETQVNTAIAANIVPQALQGQYTQATTRAEFAALAVTLYETVKGTEIDGRQTFSDTTDINVQKAAAIGVVSGVGNNNFAPNDKLTREQAATMLARLAAAIGKPLTEQAATFADNNNTSSWAVEAVGQIQAAGIMGGVGNNTFDPQGAYTREQSIVTVLRLYDVVKTSGGGAEKGESETTTYTMYADYPSIPDFGAIFGVALDHSDKTLGIPAFYYTLEYEKYEGGYASGLLNDFSAYEVYKELRDQYISVLKECGFTESVAKSVGGNYLSYWKGHGYSVLVSYMEYERSTTEPKLKITIQKI